MSTQAKVWSDGGRRACTPTETWKKLRPLLPVFGISRVANITGLDRIGIPVYTACRPNSRSLSVFQGKGVTKDAARVSAAMEAYETWCAESIDLPLKLASVDELQFSHKLISLDGLPLSNVQGLDNQHPFLWVEGWNLIGEQGCWLPFEMVHANYALPEPPHSGAFCATTNGLASGNTQEEATLHALMEVIERDAITLWKLSPDAWKSASALRLETVTDPHCRSILDMFEAAQIDVAVWDVTSDAGIPVFFCLISDRTGETGAPEFGGGAHLAPQVALSRALTEAAQARATFIAGAREDILDADYGAQELVDRKAMADSILSELQPARCFDDIANVEQDTFDADIAMTLKALEDVGIRQVVAVDIGKPNFGFAVVRVVVPGLEAALEGPDTAYVPGERASALLMEAAE